MDRENFKKDNESTRQEADSWKEYYKRCQEKFVRILLALSDAQRDLSGNSSKVAAVRPTQTSSGLLF